MLALLHRNRFKETTHHFLYAGIYGICLYALSNVSNLDHSPNRLFNDTYLHSDHIYFPHVAIRTISVNLDIGGKIPAATACGKTSNHECVLTGSCGPRLSHTTIRVMKTFIFIHALLI